MSAPKFKLLLYAWVFGMVALGASWAAIWVDGWLSAVLAIAAVISISLAVASVVGWYRQVKAIEEAGGRDPGTE